MVGKDSTPQVNRRTVLKTASAAVTTAGLATATASALESDDVVDEYHDGLSSSNRWVSMDNVDFIVVHWTVSPTVQRTINALQNQGLSYHYLVDNYDNPGHVRRLVPPERRAFHAASDAFAYDMNNRAIGVSYVYDYYRKFPSNDPHHLRDETVESMGRVIRYLCETYDIPMELYDGIGEAFTHNANGECVPAVDGGVIGHIDVPHDNDGDCSSYQSCPGFEWIPDQDPSISYPGAFQLDPDELQAAIRNSDVGGDDLFSEGEEIRALGGLVETYEQPGGGDDQVGTLETGAPGEIVNGPVEKDGETWWGIHWTDENIWGWSLESALGSVSVCDGICYGMRVETTANVNVRESTEITDNVVHTQPDGTIGTVLNGPHENDGYTWWWIEYDNGVGGWSVEQYLTESEDDGGTENETEGQTFEDGQEIRAVAAVNTREQPGLGDDVVATMNEDDPGVIVNGPVETDDYTWWGIHWTDEDIWGWSAESLISNYTGFRQGGRVETTANVNVRESAEVADNVVHTQQPGTVGTIANGPHENDGYTWWWVEYDNGVGGWSVEQYLTESDGGHEEGDLREPLPLSIETDLTDPVNVTAADIDDAIAAERSDSPLIGLGETFRAVQDSYGINALYQAAHAIHESAWGTSRIAQDKNNLFGYGAADDDPDRTPYERAEEYASFEDCLWEVMEEIHELYLTPGDWRYNGPHLDGMNTYYASDPEWDVKIADHYRTLAEHL